jgi:uncharacterized repeat protein (TIGR01451 family)
VTVNNDVVNQQIISNQAHYDWNNSNLSGDSRTITHIVGFPIITATKNASPLPIEDDPTGGIVHPGDAITYTIPVSNAGLVGSPVTVTDTVPVGTTYVAGSASCGAGASNCNASAPDQNGLITWTFDIDAGTAGNPITPATASVSFQVTVDAGDTNGQILSNFATVNNVTTRTVTHQVTFPIVDTAKSSDPASGTAQNPAPVTPGQQIKYTLTVTNAGLQDATGITVADSIPAGTTSNGDASCGDAPANTCTVNETNGVITWQLTVPAGSAGQNGITPFVEHLTFSVTVDAADTNGTLVDNTAAFTNNHTPNCVPAVGQNQDCTTNTTHHEVEFPIIALNKSANPPSGSIVQHGARIDYTVEISNSGLAAAPGTVVTDTLPDHVTLVPGSISPTPDSVSNGVITWKIDVPAGTANTPATVDLTYSVTVDQDAPEGATLLNEALVNGVCPVSSACTTDHHVPTGDLTLVKHVNHATAEYGGTLTYTFDAATTGDLDQSDVTVTDVVPAEVTYVDGSAGCTDAGKCHTSYDAATQTVTWSLGDMAHGTIRHLVFKARIDTPPADANGGLPEETIVNSGDVKSTETAATPSNKVTTVVATVLGEKKHRPTPPKVLPFTGASVPPGTAAMLGLLLISAGIVLTAAFRRVDYRARAK